MHYYQFNIGDYASHTQHLDPLEDIAYRRMLDWIYVNEKPLPDNVQQIAKYIRMRDECDRITDVLHEYFALNEYGYTQRRVEKEIAVYKDKSSKAKMAVEARWAKHRMESHTDVLQPYSECNTKQETLNTKQETLNNKNNTSKQQSRLPFNAVDVMNIWNNVFNDTYARNKKFLSETTKRRINTLTKNEFKTKGEWKTFFQALTKSDFLMGRVSSGDRKPFQLSLEWCIKEANIIKIAEGAYHA